MYPDNDLNKILPWIMLILGLLFAVAVFWTKRRFKNKFHGAIAFFKLSTIATGVFVIILWFLLPCTPVLSTFGLPKDVSDIKTPERLLKYLMDYNKALVRTTEVLHWFMFVFVWWFLAGLNMYSTVIKTQLDAKADRSLEKPTE